MSILPICYGSAVECQPLIHALRSMVLFLVREHVGVAGPAGSPIGGWTNTEFLSMFLSH